MFSIEFSILILTVKSLKEPDIYCQVMHVFGQTQRVETTTQTLFLSTGVTPWHYPTERQALLIARGLSGVSAWLFSPDIIIARVKTVTRGWAERRREGMSFPQFQNNICDCGAS